MGSIVFEENQILFVDNKIAFDCDCDCAAIGSCNPCVTNGIPDEVRLTFIDVDNDDCSDCETEYDGISFILPRFFFTDSICLWRLVLDPPICEDQVVITFTVALAFGSTYRYHVLIVDDPPPGGQAGFEAFVGGTPECLNIDMTMESNFVVTLRCNFTDASVRVEAL